MQSLRRSLSVLSLPRSATNVRSGKLMVALWRVRTGARRTLAWSSQLACAIWSELRTLPSRIALLRSNRLDQVLVFGKAFELHQGQPPPPNRCTHARIQDTQSLRETLPWVTVVDRFLFLEGWNRGFEFGRSYDTAGRGTEQTQTPILFPSPSALTSEARPCHSNPASDQTSSETPPVIAGLTRKLE